jgi:hypothetical protein
MEEDSNTLWGGNAVELATDTGLILPFDEDVLRKVNPNKYGDLKYTLIHEKPGRRSDGSDAEVPDGGEYGISADNTRSGKQVAIGHVICGISAGVLHKDARVFQLIINMNPFTDPRKVIDSVFALTIAGDIGQTVSAYNYLQREKYWRFGGIGNEAGSAELHGDIDGFMLGMWLCADKKGQEIRDRMRRYNWNHPTYGVKLSNILAEYYKSPSEYSKPPASEKIGMTASWLKSTPDPLNTDYRFINFKPTLKAIEPALKAQVTDFQEKYQSNFAKGAKLPSFTKAETKIRIEWAIEDFKKWCESGGTLAIPLSKTVSPAFRQKIQSGLSLTSNTEEAVYIADGSPYPDDDDYNSDLDPDNYDYYGIDPQPSKLAQGGYDFYIVES